MFSLLLKERLYTNEVVLGTVFGIIVGPYGADIFSPRSWETQTNFLTREVMRIVLAIGLFAIGVELPKSYMAKHAKSLIIMVVPTMTIGWIIVSGVIFGLFPKLNFISCLVIASCLTPTDPIVCAAIVGGKYARKHVPLKLRQIISAESATNDGLAFPFLSISLYLTFDPDCVTAVRHWLLVGCLYQVILGTILGTILGLMFSRLMKYFHRCEFLDRESYVAQYLALAVFVVGVASTLGTDDLLAAFAAGCAISWDGDFNERTQGESFISVIDFILKCAGFVYIGAWLPFDSFNDPGLGIVPVRLAVLFLAILVLRRIPAILAIYRWIPEIGTWREALFSGHFGPMGVSAIFVTSLALHKLPTPQVPPQTQEEVLATYMEKIVAFVVLCSIIIHGLSIPLFSLGKHTLTRANMLVEKAPSWAVQILQVPIGKLHGGTNVNESKDNIDPGTPQRQPNLTSSPVDNSCGEIFPPPVGHFPSPAQ